MYHNIVKIFSSKYAIERFTYSPYFKLRDIAQIREKLMLK